MVFRQKGGETNFDKCQNQNGYFFKASLRYAHAVAMSANSELISKR